MRGVTPIDPRAATEAGVDLEEALYRVIVVVPGLCTPEEFVASRKRSASTCSTTIRRWRRVPDRRCNGGGPDRQQRTARRGLASRQASLQTAFGRRLEWRRRSRPPTRRSRPDIAFLPGGFVGRTVVSPSRGWQPGRKIQRHGRLRMARGYRRWPERPRSGSPAIRALMDHDSGTRPIWSNIRACVETRQLREAAQGSCARNSLRYRLDLIRKVTGLDPPRARRPPGAAVAAPARIGAWVVGAFGESRDRRDGRDRTFRWGHHLEFVLVWPHCESRSSQHQAPRSRRARCIPPMGSPRMT